MPVELIFAIVFFVFALVALACWRGIKTAKASQDAKRADPEYRRASYETVWTDSNVAAAKWTTVGLLAVGLFFVLLSSVQVVSTKNVGIETAFGHVEGELSNGLHLTWPWVNVTEMDAAIQTDSYTGGFRSNGTCSSDALKARIANQQSACVDISIRWRIRPDKAGELYQNYHTFDNVRDSLVTRELIAAVNNQLRDYNPLNSVQYGVVSQGATPNKPYSAIAADVTAQMRREIGSQIEVLNTILPYVSFDPKTQNRIDQLQQQIALTRIAQQAKTTNQEQAKANNALSKSVDTSPNVLVAQCYQILQEIVKNGDAVPPGFTCWPGGQVAGIIANTGK